MHELFYVEGLCYHECKKAGAGKLVLQQTENGTLHQKGERNEANK